MFRYIAAGLCLALVGCQHPKNTAMPAPYTITEELRVQVNPTASDDQLNFKLSHRTYKQEKGKNETVGSKGEFAIMVVPSTWARVKRSGVVIGYASETECLLDGEMVNVSGMPGENFTVKVEPLPMDRYRVIGIFLASRFSESGELGKTIPFDFVAELGKETTVYRKTIVFDPEARLGEEPLLRNSP
jgi:hypothetical protein